MLCSHYVEIKVFDLIWSYSGIITNKNKHEVKCFIMNHTPIQFYPNKRHQNTLINQHPSIFTFINNLHLVTLRT